MTTNRAGQTRRITLAIVAMLAAILATAVVNVGPATAATPNAQPAAYPHSSYNVADYPRGHVGGNFIWYNRSVQVGGTVFAAGDVCSAVVYTAYDNGNHVVARQVRPADNVYTCDSLGHGFTLDAADVVGGIHKIVVDLWEYDLDSGDIWNGASGTFFRP